MVLMDRHMFDVDEASKETRKDAGLTKEDIESLIVDENLYELDRMKMFLSPTAHQLQQSCALTKLPTIFHEYGLRAYHALFPGLGSALHEFSPPIQVAAGEAFLTIMHDGSLPKEVAVKILSTVIGMLDAYLSKEVVYIWLDTLCAMAPLLPRKMLTEDLLKLALSKGPVEETSQSRIICSRIYGAIAPLLEGAYIEQNFLQKAMELCQDTDSEVRICMCQQLDRLGRAVGIEATKRTIIPELYELLKDEEVLVRRAALESLVQMLDFFPSEIRRLKVLPIICQICGHNDSVMLICLARLFGVMILKMVPDLHEDDIQLLINSYKFLSCHPNEKIRRLAAFNFPAILKALGARKYASLLHTIYLQFVKDSASSVRTSIAASLHEVSKMLGKERSATYLKDPFILLLKDPSRDVQSALLPILQHVLGQFSVSDEQQKSSIYAAIIPPLIQSEKAISCTNQWRLQVFLLNSFCQLPVFLTSDQIYEHFVPVCFRYMIDGVLPVRSAATMALAIFIRNNRHTTQRYEISQKVVKEFGYGQSYWSRLVFIEFCESMLKVSSTLMFRQNFLDAALVTLQDVIVSVRMRACLLLPLLKASIKLPDDVAALERINFYATQRLNDNDRQVAAAARSIADSLKHAVVRCTGLETGLEAFSSQAEFEALDKQREEEEWNMLSKEEQDEKKKLDEALQKFKVDASKRAPGSTASTYGLKSGITSADKNVQCAQAKAGMTNKVKVVGQGWGSTPAQDNAWGDASSSQKSQLKPKTTFGPKRL